MYKFSIIMPSFLGEYKGAAKYRVEKFHRAVQSALNQSFKNFELVVVSDGCSMTDTVLKEYQYPFVTLKSIAKQPTFSGTPRNTGIHIAQGEYIVYLDTDDYLDVTHLESIASGLNGFDWVYFDEWILLNKAWTRRVCDINIRFRNGTSNICHKRAIPVQWGGGYEHDYEFIQALKRVAPNYSRIDAGGYFVCHIPNRYDI